jgi:ubiquinone/menaquinone biosynthesis C-methylase UbiE
MNPNAFDGLASAYSRFRPDYPKELFENTGRLLLKNRPEVRQGAIVIDVGSGTGISTRLLKNTLGRDIPVIGIEPGTDMIQEAIQLSKGWDNLCYLRGVAEKLCFSSDTVDLILVAQALQWFSRQQFYQEASRILKQNGVLAIVQNNRDWENSPFLDDYEQLLEKYSPGYSRHYRSFNITEELSQCKDFYAVERTNAEWERIMTCQEFTGMARSSTKYKKAQDMNGPKFIDDRLDKLLTKHFGQRQVRVKYTSELYSALRR